MCGEYRKPIRNVSLVAAVEKRLLSDLFFTDKEVSTPSREGDSIVIVGGELFNKGAQAMTFTVVDQMSKRYPEKDVYLLSGRDYERDPDEKAQYEFNILPWGPETQLSLLSPELDFGNTTQYPKQDKKAVKNVLEDCSMLIDINGFALSSQMGAKTSFIYLTDILIAGEYDVPMYILPQSIGPFDYSSASKLLLNPLMQTYLSYPDVICPREQAGVKSLAPYTRNNVRREFDIVLQNEGYDPANIYTSEPDLERKDLESEAVGIVPNSQVFERTDPEELYSVYDAAIEALLENGKTTYVLRHSIEDLDLCREIEKRFSENDNVVLFEEDLNAIELEHIIRQFDFLLGSRYHSLVHAYKNQVPAIAIGWAVKYRELLDRFDQSAYFFEGRDEIDEQELVSAVEQMCNSYDCESELIGEKVDEIQQNDLFGDLFDD
ncbi:polysaccharide pyruvyl transferase family protein [Halalkaliarchaeum sp. AArc-GB]|uniref:polysaccharide pyruvyl transferase family protein n=1 Tax=Halalkaliarchaeum sp. AArc-GB TaxID=3074078 RepID=UPI0028567BBA|nr:polysaccharide pyruvyl transferase family protein [Halalkaliarchaeum sp. AArc-GB]MDR5674218.1 polysaccharide pyruvyl transferase family protein [Halalkaliarchaeum sp. AArc-GB]